MLWCSFLSSVARPLKRLAHRVVVRPREAPRVTMRHHASRGRSRPREDPRGLARPRDAPRRPRGHKRPCEDTARLREASRGPAPARLRETPRGVARPHAAWRGSARLRCASKSVGRVSPPRLSRGIPVHRCVRLQELQLLHLLLVLLLLPQPSPPTHNPQSRPPPKRTQLLTDLVAISTNG